jgi:hypothetical protein
MKKEGGGGIFNGTFITKTWEPINLNKSVSLTDIAIKTLTLSFRS